MKITTLILLAGALFTTAVAALPGLPDKQALAEHVRTGPALLNTDFETWAAGYHPEWSYWRPGSTEVRPRAAHMPLVEANMAGGMRIDGFDIEIVETFVSGDLGFVRYNATERLTQADGTTRSVRFSAASLYTRASGKWQALRSNLFYAPDTVE